MKYGSIKEKYKINILLIFLFFLAAFLPYQYLSISVILGIGLFLFLIVESIFKNEDFDFIFALFLMSLIMRIAIAFLLYQIRSVSGKFPYMGDGDAYIYNGNNILDIWIVGIRAYEHIFNYAKSISGSGTINVYDFWNAFVLFITDRNPFSLAIINSLFGAWIIVFSYQITLFLLNRRAARIAAVFVAFWPSLFLWSTQNFKEPMTCFLLTGILLYFLKLARSFRFRYLIIIVLGAACLKTFRFPIFIIFYSTAIVWLVMNKMYKFIIKRNAVLFCIVLVFLIMLGVIFLKTKKIYLTDVISWINVMRSYRTYGNLAFLSHIKFYNVYEVILFLPQSLLIVFLSPFPWQLGSMSQTIVSPEMIFFYFLIGFLIKGAIHLYNNKKLESLLIIGIIITMNVFLALFEGNIGTMFRHRAMILPLYFILIAIGIESNFKRTFNKK